MASEELVTEQFQFLGIDVQNEVVTKCVSLCAEYDVDAESFTEQWMAFSLNHLNGASPDLENLDLFARKEFSKRSSSRSNASAKDTARAITGTSLTVYGTPNSNQSDNDVLSNYIAVTPKNLLCVQRVELCIDPTTTGGRLRVRRDAPYGLPRVKIEAETGGVQQNDLRPATYSPTVGSTKYASRTNMGTVVHSYGDESLLQIVATPNSPTDVIDLKITQVPNEDGDIYTKAQFGFELLHEKSGIFDNHIRYISQYIMKKAGITDSTSVRQKTQTEVTVAGRIECDADARLNVKSVILQGTWAESLCQTVPVDLDNVKQYSLFPGQVVVMKGINPRGDRFIAQEVFCDASQPIRDHKADMMNTLSGNVSMVISSGPYTTSDNMNYAPLKDLVAYINTHRPHLVIMTGPFIDCEHSMIKDNTIAETYSALFDKIVDSLGELSSTSPYTKVYIVSNLKDAFHVNIYPTPPYSSRRKHPNIHFISDPSTINVNSVVIGVTSCDVLMQISQEEISLGVGGDKLSRLARHVVAQQSYAPLWPPPAGHAVDAALWAAHAQLPCTPHLLVLPSNFRYFVKEVNGCVVVNPEHLTKGTGGGTFARVLISSSIEHNMSFAAQIVRI